MNKGSISLHTVLKNQLQNGVITTQVDFIRTILWRQKKRKFAASGTDDLDTPFFWDKHLQRHL